jgi:hypothetical protein
MTERPVIAEIARTIVSICFPLFRIFEAHHGSNIRKGGKQKYRRDQKVSGVFFAMTEKTPYNILRPVKGETTVSTCRLRIFFVLLIHGMDR